MKNILFDCFLEAKYWTDIKTYQARLYLNDVEGMILCLGNAKRVIAIKKRNQESHDYNLHDYVITVSFVGQ